MFKNSTFTIHTISGMRLIIAELFITFTHHFMNIYEVATIVVIKIILFYYCSCIYPVAVSILRRTRVGWRGGTVKYNYWIVVLSPPQSILLNLLHDNVCVPLALIYSLLDQRNKEQDQTTQCNGYSR